VRQYELRSVTVRYWPVSKCYVAIRARLGRDHNAMSTDRQSLIATGPPVPLSTRQFGERVFLLCWVGFSLFHTKPRDRLGAASPK